MFSQIVGTLLLLAALVPFSYLHYADWRKRPQWHLLPYGFVIGVAAVIAARYGLAAGLLGGAALLAAYGALHILILMVRKLEENLE